MAVSIYALNKDFEVITVAVPYNNLQWTRKYYEAGEFSMQVPLSAYSSDWKYIGTSDRPEIGMVQKIETSGVNDTHVQVSGFFCEKMLDDKTVYPRYKTDAAKTETAVRDIFSKYKDDLPIILAPANNPLLGNRTQLDFSDDQLGEKLYSMLEDRELSYRVLYDYEKENLTFGVWQGVDRTESNGKNGYQTFSIEYGNIAELEAVFDDSGYKNYAIIPCNSDEDGKEQEVIYVDKSNGGYKREIVFDMRSKRPEKEKDEEDLDEGEEWKSQAQLDNEFREEVLEDGRERLKQYEKVEDIDINIVGNIDYMVDYDLGDKCDVLITNLGLQMETRIVEISEVFKDSSHTVTVGLGNKRISNIRRAVMRR